MKRISTLFFCLLVTIPVLYSCNPESYAADDFLYQDQHASGDDEGDVNPDKNTDPNNGDENPIGG